MDTPYVYRKSAADTLRLAQRAANPAAKERLLDLAEKWFALAERARDFSNRDEANATRLGGRRQTF
jgi:hypothetical protein